MVTRPDFGTFKGFQNQFLKFNKFRKESILGTYMSVFCFFVCFVVVVNSD